MTLWRRCVVLLLGVLGAGLAQPYEHIEQTLTLGVFAFRPVPVMLERYQPLADYLSAALPNTQIELQVLDREALDVAVDAQEIDLLLTSPGHYVVLRHRSGLTSALATLITLEQGHAVNSIGGVIFTTADREDIVTLSNLRNRSIAIPGEHFFSAYQTTLYELQQIGIRLPRDANVVVTGSFDAVLTAVLEGQADVGLVRTGILEEFISDHILSPDQIKIINPQEFAGFPFKVSTRLYPERPLIAVRHFDQESLRHIITALLALTPDHPAARAAGIAGFTPPLDYMSVEQLTRALQLPPFDQIPYFTWRDVWFQYQWFLLATTACLVLIFMLLFALIGRNQQLLQAVHEQQQMREALHQSETRLHDTLAHVPVGIVAADLETRRFVFANHYFSQMLGYSRSELEGMTPLDIHPPADLPRIIQEFEKMLQGDSSASLDIPVQCKDGRIFPADIYRSPVVLEGRSVVLGVFVDVSVRQEAERERMARQRIEAAHQAKSTFLAHMSHEIRTPLNAIIGFAQLLSRDTELKRQQREHVQTIARSGEHLLMLINDILDFSKIEADQVTLHLDAVNLHDLCGDMQRMFAERAQAKGVQWLVERSASVPSQVRADEAKLRQILINLIGNALKFTQEGSVTLRVYAEPLPAAMAAPEAARVRLYVEVDDTGPGISDRDQSRIFDAFQQSQAGHHSGGTGLGLAISQRLVELMGGELSLVSHLGQGSCFRFHIPLLLSSALAGRPPLQMGGQVVGLEPSSEPWRILVVDDRKDNRDVLRHLLESVGFTVSEAVDGQAALSAFARTEPHAVLMDIRMPVMDGFEATQWIKATAKGHATPVIAVTASVSPEDERRMLASGVDAYIRKPFQVEELLATLGRALKLNYLYTDVTTDDFEHAVHRRLNRDAVLALNLPATLMVQLGAALKAGDMQELETLITQVAVYDESIAQGLAELAAQYDYDTLSELLQET